MRSCVHIFNKLLKRRKKLEKRTAQSHKPNRFHGLIVGACSPYDRKTGTYLRYNRNKVLTFVDIYKHGRKLDRQYLGNRIKSVPPLEIFNSENKRIYPIKVLQNYIKKYV
jgi:hypothetical protein